VVAMLLEDMLLELEVEVVGPVATVAEALALTAVDRLDAGLLDVNLGGERSYPVAEALAARNVPFLFLTGYGEAGWDGGGETLQKPYRAEQIEAALARLIG